MFLRVFPLWTCANLTNILMKSVLVTMNQCAAMNMLLFSLIQGIRVDLSCKQLTVDFVNQSVLQMSGQDVDSKRSDKTDFAERLGAMNRRWQILQGRINERVRPQTLILLMKPRQPLSKSACYIYISMTCRSSF